MISMRMAAQSAPDELRTLLRVHIAPCDTDFTHILGQRLDDETAHALHMSPPRALSRASLIAHHLPAVQSVVCIQIELCQQLTAHELSLLGLWRPPYIDLVSSPADLCTALLQYETIAVGDLKAYTERRRWRLHEGWLGLWRMDSLLHV